MFESGGMEVCTVGSLGVDSMRTLLVCDVLVLEVWRFGKMGLWSE